MITDEIVEAVDTLIEMCSDTEQEHGMRSIREMICDFDEYKWNATSEADRKDWLQRYLRCVRKKGV